MRTTTEKAVIGFRILYGDKHLGGMKEGARIGKMEKSEQFKIVKIMKELKPVVASYDDFVKDSAEKLKPEGVEKIQSKIQGGEELTAEEEKAWREYNQTLAELLQEELSKEIEFSFAPLSEEGFKGLLESNDFSLAEAMILDEIIAE